MKAHLIQKVLNYLIILGLCYPQFISGKFRSNSFINLNRKPIISNFNHSQKLKYQPGVLVLKITSESALMNPGNPLQSINAGQNPLAAILKRFQISKIEKAFPEAKSPLNPQRVDLSRIYRIHFPATVDAVKLACKLATDESIEYAEPLYLRELAFVPNDSLYNKQWHLQKIQAEKAWDLQKGDSTVIVGIVDSGVDWLHPDLASKIWINPDEIPDNGLDDDNNGFVDDIRGWDFGEADNEPRNTSSALTAAHGSHTAGIAAAATNNQIGVASIGFHCKIMAIKCTFDYEKDAQQNIRNGFQGIKYAVDNGADIVSCSWSGPSASQYEFDIIRYAHEHGVAVVAAAGNYNEDTQYYPAAYQYVFSVAATNQFDEKYGRSNFHYSVDIAAPGTNILSIWGHTDEYVENSGTSMATPLVAGTIALVKSARPNWTAEQAGHQVRIAADDIHDLNAGYYFKLGKGRLNAFRALKEISPAIRLEAVAFSDSALGDGDEIIDPGEQVEIILSWQNFLHKATNVKFTLFTKDPYVGIPSRYATFEVFDSNSIQSNAKQPFVIEVAPDIPFGHEIDFLVDIDADGGYEDWDNFSLIAAPLYATHDIGNVAFTLTSFGALGYYDYVNSEQTIGEGFQYPKGSVSALFHGSLIVASGPLNVSDCAYGNVLNNAYDWQMTTDGAFRFSAEVSDQDGYAQYDDSVATNPIGVTVTQRSYAWSTPPFDDFVILEFDIQNIKPDSIPELYVALYMDWDIGDAVTNRIDYISENNLGYQYADASNFYGIALLEPPLVAGYRAVNNEQYIWTDAFHDKQKWLFLTEGFRITKSDTPADWSQLMTAGPFLLEQFAHQKVAFVVLGGDSKPDIIQNTQAAKEKYRQLTGVASSPDNQVSAKDCTLSPNFPNPFNQSTHIRYFVTRSAHLTIGIFNLKGQLVKILVNQEQAPGAYQVQWDGSSNNGVSVSSGIYLVQFKTMNYLQTRKIVLVK